MSYLCLRENQMHKSLDDKQELLTRTRLLGIITDDPSQGKIIFLHINYLPFSSKVLSQYLRFIFVLKRILVMGKVAIVFF